MVLCYYHWYMLYQLCHCVLCRLARELKLDLETELLILNNFEIPSSVINGSPFSGTLRDNLIIARDKK